MPSSSISLRGKIVAILEQSNKGNKLEGSPVVSTKQQDAQFYESNRRFTQGIIRDVEKIGRGKKCII